MRVLKLYKRRFDTRNTQRGLRADMIPFAVHWRPKLRCFDGEIYVNLSTMKVQMASARKIRTGCLLDAWAFVLTQEPYSAGTVRVQPGPPEDAVPLENPVTAGNALAEQLHPG